MAGDLLFGAKYQQNTWAEPNFVLLKPLPPTLLPLPRSRCDADTTLSSSRHRRCVRS